MFMFSFPAESKRSSLPTDWLKENTPEDKEETTIMAFRLALNGKINEYYKHNE